MTGQPERGGGSATGSYDTGSVTVLTDEQKRDARRVVDRNARGVDDCRELLAMLDLLETETGEKAS